MREAMEKMEEERAQLVAEVEAQIERALASMSMAIDVSDSEDGSQAGSHRSVLADSRPASGPGSRRSSNAGQSFPPRSISTESTLAETAETDEETRHSVDSSVGVTEEDAPPRSITNVEAPRVVERGNDAMSAVDEGIHQNTDNISKKVLQIQQKVRRCYNVIFSPV